MINEYQDALLSFRIGTAIQSDYEIIEKLVKKATPTKPYLYGDYTDIDGNNHYTNWVCPCCEEDYEIDYHEYKYCPICGQAIDRSEME